MKNIANTIKNVEGGFEIVGAKKIVRGLNDAFMGGHIDYDVYKECKNALIDNLTNPEFDRIRISNMFVI